MDDIQNRIDKRGITIQQTGVKNVCLPFLIRDNDELQHVQANICFTVALSKNLKGTHMSRLLEILNKHVVESFSINDVNLILNEALEKLITNSAKIKIAFKYFMKHNAPVSKKISLLDLDCFFEGEVIDDDREFSLGVTVPITTLCPCSKEISEFGAHNQRSICTVKVKFNDQSFMPSIKNLANLIETQASSPIYPILKREDEKYVTEAAYQNPKFVEDILRDVVIAVRKIQGIKWFSVECENFESIHNHNAFAYHEEKI